MWIFTSIHPTKHLCYLPWLGRSSDSQTSLTILLSMVSSASKFSTVNTLLASPAIKSSSKEFIIPMPTAKTWIPSLLKTIATSSTAEYLPVITTRFCETPWLLRPPLAHWKRLWTNLSPLPVNTEDCNCLILLICSFIMVSIELIKRKIFLGLLAVLDYSNMYFVPRNNKAVHNFQHEGLMTEKLLFDMLSDPSIRNTRSATWLLQT